MKPCIDCGKPVETRGWATGQVCHRCRAVRANRSKRERLAASGKVTANKWLRDPLDATGRL